MKFLLILASLTAHTQSAPLREYLESWRSSRGEDEICARTIHALQEYDALIETGFTDEQIAPDRPPGALRAQLLETLAGCFGYD